MARGPRTPQAVAGPATGLALPDTPGHLVRRAQRVHTALWAELVGEPTGPQFAVLSVIAGEDDLDQSAVGQAASLDTSSVADVVRRLARDHWLARRTDPADARRKLLSLTPSARASLGELTVRVAAVQDALLQPVPPGRRHALVRRLSVLAYEGRPPSVGRPGRGGLPLPRTPGHLLRRAQQAHTVRWFERFGTTLTGPQYAVLCVVAQQPTGDGADQSTIGHLASLDKSSVAEVVERLLHRGLLSRTADPGDRRRRTVRLSTEGVDQLPAITERAADVQRSLLSLFPAAERADVVDDLRSLAYR